MAGMPEAGGCDVQKTRVESAGAVAERAGHGRCRQRHHRWDEKAVGIVQTRMAPPAGYRIMAMLHLVMFEAVNSIEPRYKPYKAKLTASPDASKEAAAAAAAGMVLSKLVPEAAADVQAAATSYLATLPDGEAKANGIKLGEQSAQAMLDARANDGFSARDAYRPRTMPGVYVPTPITVGSHFPNVTPSR
jgi:hypothetical protein